MKIADLHCDTISKIYESNIDSNLMHNHYQIDARRMQASNYMLQNFAMFIDSAKYENPYITAKEMISCYYKQLKLCNDYISPVKKYSDISNNRKINKISALLTIEDSTCFMDGGNHIDEFYDLGVRMTTLTWNYRNFVGYPNFDFSPYIALSPNELKDVSPDFITPNTINGITTEGIEFIHALEEKGIIIDVSHGSDKLFFDVLNNTSKPFVLSHSNSRYVCNHVRNATDEMIKALADRGGIIGINFCPDFINNAPNSIAYVSSIAKHIEHIYNIGGSEVLALGTDFDGISGRYEIEDCSQMYLLVNELNNKNLSNSFIEKIMFKNVLRLYKEML